MYILTKVSAWQIFYGKHCYSGTTVSVLISEVDFIYINFVCICDKTKCLD